MLISDLFAAEVGTDRSTIDNPRMWMSNLFGGGKTSSGERVSPESAMKFSAYFACGRNISEDVGKLPLIVYRRVSAGAGRERADNVPLYSRLKSNPCPYMTAQAFYELLTQWAFYWGGGIADIDYDGRGDPVFWPIHPSRVTVKLEKGALWFYVRGNDGRSVRLPDADVLHIRGYGGEVTGYSLAGYAAEAIGMGLAAQRFGASFYANDASTGLTLIPMGEMKKEAREELRRQWVEQHAGAEKAYAPRVLGQEFKIERGTMPLNEAQFIEAREFQIEDMARFARMPLNKIQHSKRAQGWSTLDADNTSYLTDTIDPWLTRWEQEMDRKLFTPAERKTFFVEFLAQKLMRMDHASRGAWYNQRFLNGSMSPNDIRRLENENPIADPAADMYYVQRQMTTLSQAAAPPVPPPAPVPAAGPDMPDGGGGDHKDDMEPEDMEKKGERAQHAAMMRPVIEHAAARVARREAKAVLAQGAKKPAQFAAWAEGWFPGHAEYIVGEFAPVIRGCLGATGPGDKLRALAAEHARDAARRVVDAHARGKLEGVYADEAGMAAAWTATVCELIENG